MILEQDLDTFCLLLKIELLRAKESIFYFQLDFLFALLAFVGDALTLADPVLWLIWL